MRLFQDPCRRGVKGGRGQSGGAFAAALQRRSSALSVPQLSERSLAKVLCEPLAGAPSLWPRFTFYALHLHRLMQNLAMHILLVDDHRLFSAGLSVLLEEVRPGAQLSCANTIAKALNPIGPFDLILLDLHLPDARDYDGLDRLKAAYEATPIVVVSGEDDPERIRNCISHGAMGFVPKSSNAKELFRALSLILGGESYLPPACVMPPCTDAVKSASQTLLSPRQKEVLLRVVQGKPNKIIARELGISDQTVKSHVMAVLTVLGVKNRTEAVYRAAALGI